MNNSNKLSVYYLYSVQIYKSKDTTYLNRMNHTRDGSFTEATYISIPMANPPPVTPIRRLLIHSSPLQKGYSNPAISSLSQDWRTEQTGTAYDRPL